MLNSFVVCGQEMKILGACRLSFGVVFVVPFVGYLSAFFNGAEFGTTFLRAQGNLFEALTRPCALRKALRGLTTCAEVFGT